MDGAATFTIVESRMFMIIAARTAAKPVQRRRAAARSAAWSAAVAAVGAAVVAGEAAVRSSVVVTAAPFTFRSVDVPDARRPLGTFPSAWTANLGAMAETSGRLLT